ncbi:hypothetical protein AC481_01925 [miscellaneous Crenarchaeota group archaeon SMTZ-80]|nr:MAG: hypothetical protein AC481_01925 [miscellaneous Crenarchaeota group archaeon SMTZ-80]
MVLTPFHYSIPWVLNQFFRKKSNLPFLGLTAMVQDFEVIFLYFLGIEWPYNRFILHSLFGAITIDLLLAFTLAPLWFLSIRKLFKLKFHLKLRKFDIPLGILCSFSHVFIDALHHRYNPIFVPFSSKSFNGLVIFGDWIKATFIVQFIFSMLFLIIVIYEIRRNQSIKEFVKSFLIN